MIFSSYVPAQGTILPVAWGNTVKNGTDGEQNPLSAVVFLHNSDSERMQLFL